MFDHDITFYGKHADYLRKLAPSKIAGDSLTQGYTVFNSNIDIITAAPLVGLMFNRKSDRDLNNGITKNNIFLQQVVKVSAQLRLSFRILMLLANDENLSDEERINRAFRYESNPEKLKPLEDLFFQYMRGGIEVLYERLIKDSTSVDDDINNIFSFVEECKNMAKGVSKDDLAAMCSD